MSKPPILKGGQGRSAEDLENAAGWIFFLVLIVVILAVRLYYHDAN